MTAQLKTDLRKIMAWLDSYQAARPEACPSKLLHDLRAAFPLIHSQFEAEGLVELWKYRKSQRR